MEKVNVPQMIFIPVGIFNRVFLCWIFLKGCLDGLFCGRKNEHFIHQRPYRFLDWGLDNFRLK